MILRSMFQKQKPSINWLLQSLLLWLQMLPVEAGAEAGVVEARAVRFRQLQQLHHQMQQLVHLKPQGSQWLHVAQASHALMGQWLHHQGPPLMLTLLKACILFSHATP